jgi:hypothetical protein
VLHISGTLEKPEVKTAVAREFIFYPIGVLRRALTLPVKPFE